MDFSECIDDNRSQLQHFFCKFDKNSNVRYLTLDAIIPDLNNSIEVLGEALGSNVKMEVLNMSNNRIKTT